MIELTSSKGAWPEVKPALKVAIPVLLSSCKFMCLGHFETSTLHVSIDSY